MIDIICKLKDKSECILFIMRKTTLKIMISKGF